MPRKIKVVNINNDKIEDGKEIISSEVNDIIQDETKDEVKDEVRDETESEVKDTIQVKHEMRVSNAAPEINNDVKNDTEETVSNNVSKNIRQTELIRCPNCNKNVTAKTLKYSHSKTCGGLNRANSTDGKYNKPHNEQFVISEQPKPLLSFEEMRREYMVQRSKLRTQKLQSLMASAF